MTNIIRPEYVIGKTLLYGMAMKLLEANKFSYFKMAVGDIPSRS